MSEQSSKPYDNEALNKIYELLFCDNIQLYKNGNAAADQYPWNILLNEKARESELEKVAVDGTLESRTRILAFNQIRLRGGEVKSRELLGVIVEVAMENGLDVLAAFKDGTARYINYTGQMVIWETRTDQSDDLLQKLCAEGEKIVQQIGPWDKERKPHPTNGNCRINFLVADGLYFGEGPSDVLFEDPFANPTLMAATSLMEFLTGTIVRAKKS